MDIYKQLPPEAVQIVLVLFLSFLIGLEREERKTEEVLTPSEGCALSR